MDTYAGSACQENQPKSLQHNTLNKSRHRKETAQSLFMAELQRLSSKQQILLNFYHVSDEQRREKDGAAAPAIGGNRGFLNRRMKKSNQVFFSSPRLPPKSIRTENTAIQCWLKRFVCFRGAFYLYGSSPNNLMSESNQFTLFN